SRTERAGRSPALLGKIKPAPAGAGRSVSGMNRRLAAGYVVWGATAVVVGVPEIWAAVDSDGVPWPTISGTVVSLESEHDWVAVVVVGLLVWALFHALRRPVFAALARAGLVAVPAVVYFPIGVAVVGGSSFGVY